MIPQKTFGDTLHGVLTRTIQKDASPGLLVLQFPTGSGKSYAVERTIATLASKMPESAPPILFVTPQKKNIPDEATIIDLCRAEGLELAPHAVMRLQSVNEMLSETVHEDLLESIPEEHKTKTNIEELIDTVRYLKNSKGCDEAIRRLVSTFKRSVRSLFPVKGWEERLELLEQGGEWKWLADLWPSIFTRRAKILLMTSAKFFNPHDTLIEAACPIDQAEWIRGAIIFMDEFDSTKNDCLRAITSRSTKDRCDLPGLVRTLWRGVNLSTAPQSLFAGNDTERNIDRFRQLKGILDEAAGETHVDYVYKAAEGVLNTAGLFMYDGTRRGTNLGTPYYVKTDTSRRENVIVTGLRVGDESRTLASDVNELRGAITYTQRVIVSILRDRHGYGLDGMDEEAMKNEILSTLEALGVKDRSEQLFMLQGIGEMLKGGKRSRGSLRDGQTMYEQGFGLVAIEDSEAHRFSTHIYAYAMDDTPEKRLRSLIERSFVVGLSATARIDSPLCNYDLDWLSEQRPSLMRTLTSEDSKLLEEAYARHTEGYKRIDLQAVPISVPQATDETPYREAASIVENASLQEKMTILLSGVTCDDHSKPDGYQVLRYIRVGKAYRYFLEQVPEGVFLCVTSAAPKHGMDTTNRYAIETLRRLFDIIRRDLGVPDDDDSVRYISDSEDFQNRYKDMVAHLGEGCPRMFICASYGSIATGVNLQYDGKGMRTVSISENSFDSRVDISGVYLDRITNVAPTNSRIHAEARVEGTLICAYELKEMVWHGDLSVDEMDKVARSLIGSYPPKDVKLVDKPSVKAACTKMATQMVGRMCRTSNKTPTVHVLFDDNLAETIDPYAMGDDLVGVETRELLSKVASLAHQQAESKGRIENLIASRAAATARYLSELSRRSTWPKAEMDMWEKMRLWGLRHPSPTEEELSRSEMSNFYVDVKQPVESLRYFERDDFSNVGVSLEMSDSEDFPLEVSDRAARLDVLECIPEVRNLFEREGWPLHWKASNIIMNPAFFRNVYLGAIGEQAGKVILESRVRGLKLEAIADPRKFEKFDYVVSGTDIYVDFKYWRSPDLSGGNYVEWIRKKMQGIGATHALIVNLVCGDEFRGKTCEEIEGNILAVPYLVDDANACIAENHMGRIRSWLKEIGALQ